MSSGRKEKAPVVPTKERRRATMKKKDDCKPSPKKEGKRHPFFGPSPMKKKGVADGTRGGKRKGGGKRPLPRKKRTSLRRWGGGRGKRRGDSFLFRRGGEKEPAFWKKKSQINRKKGKMFWLPCKPNGLKKEGRSPSFGKTGRKRRSVSDPLGNPRGDRRCPTQDP